MMEFIFWLYLLNATLLIVHEIDSAYWQEWKLFHLLGGETGFLLLHIPLLMPVLYGLVLLELGTLAGLVLSVLVCVSGLFAFSIHTFFLRRGHPEFKTPVSLGILWTILLVSLAQLGLTVLMLVQIFGGM
jgi:hypothetical protein